MKTTSLLGIALFAIFLHQQPQQFPEDFLKRQDISSIAILPPLGQSVPAAARQLSADLFITKFRLRSSAVRAAPPDAVTALLDKGGLTGDFGTFVNLYSQTGTVNSEALKKFGHAIGTDALVLIHVLNYDEEKGSWWYGKGGKNICRIQYTLFRSTTGEKIWESLEFRQHDSKVSTNPYPMERVIGDVSDKAVSSLLTGTQNVDVRQKQSK